MQVCAAVHACLVCVRARARVNMLIVADCVVPVWESPSDK